MCGSRTTAFEAVQLIKPPASPGVSDGLTEARDDAILLGKIAERSNLKPDVARILPQLHLREKLPLEGLCGEVSAHSPAEARQAE